jgi:ABC-type amino acid transport substrate-binding protein
VAAALFGDANAVKFTPLTSKERFTALQSGEVDVLSPCSLMFFAAPAQKAVRSGAARRQWPTFTPWPNAFWAAALPTAPFTITLIFLAVVAV